MQEIKKIAALLLIIIGCIRASYGNEAEKYSACYKYTIYAGLNDRSQYRQIIRNKEAERIINQICSSHCSSYTLQRASGCWHDGRKLTKENSFIIIILSDNEQEGAEKAQKIAEEITEQLNQSCVLIEKAEVTIKAVDHK